MKEIREFVSDYMILVLVTRYVTILQLFPDKF
jgi:hypothetical protein